MNINLGTKIICDSLTGLLRDPINGFGDENINSNVVIRTSQNEQLFYLDGACGGLDPIFIGLTKSRGDQKNKLPIQNNDMLGGLQVYGRIKKGNSLGYNLEETPLTGAIQFKVSDYYDNKSNIIPSELLIALSDQNEMSIKLILDSNGNLKISGNLQTGKLCITDIEISNIKKKKIKFVKVIYDDIEYALPLYHLI